jgi:hypothetical protein
LRKPLIHFLNERKQKASSREEIVLHFWVALSVAFVN